MPDFARVVKKSGDINKIAAHDRARIGRAMGETAQIAASVARQLVPVRTGALRDSIYVEQRGDLTFYVGASESYASFIELGTVFSPAQPFLRPAIEFARKDLLAMFKKS